MLVPCCFVAFDMLVLILTVLPLRRMYASPNATGIGTLTEFLLDYGTLSAVSETLAHNQKILGVLYVR